MATKTISIDLEAYERLTRARERPDESFSKVIKRANWNAPVPTAGAYLAAVFATPPVDESEIERLEEVQRNDLPPRDPWAEDA